jgi:hypothetical protein
MNLTKNQKRRATRLLELMSVGGLDDEAQAEFDRLMTPKLQLLFAEAILAIVHNQNNNKDCFSCLVDHRSLTEDR